jgi:ribosomal protein S18 acetylase RimI-like enzyme
MAENKQLCVTRIGPENIKQLSRLFSIIQNDPAALHFHPHLFNENDALTIATYKGRDLYLGAFRNGDLIGYGMLRGWDEGYTIPALGIYFEPDARGKGYAAIFMSELHRQARENGATRVRLKVYPSNAAAVKLYRRLGYEFNTEENGQLVGLFNLIS